MGHISAPKWSFGEQSQIKIKLVLFLDVEVISHKMKQSILVAIQDLKQIDSTIVVIPSHTSFPPSSTLQEIEQYLDRAAPPNVPSLDGLLKFTTSMDENEFYSILLFSDRYSDFELYLYV